MASQTEETLLTDWELHELIIKKLIHEMWVALGLCFLGMVLLGVAIVLTIMKRLG